MRCFNHAEIRAVGLCKNCCKGLCHNCLTDVGNGLACTGQCVERLQMFNKYNSQLVKQGADNAPVIFALGALFIVVGLYYAFTSTWGVTIFFMISIGLILILWGWKQRQARKP